MCNFLCVHVCLRIFLCLFEVNVKKTTFDSFVMIDGDRQCSIGPTGVGPM